MPVENLQNGSVTENTAKFLKKLEKGVQPGPSTSKLPQVIDGSVTELTANDLAGATIIKPNAFYNCTSLTSVIIPNSVTSIGDGAFRYCDNINVVIPASVTYIGDYAFDEADASLTFLSDTPLDISGEGHPFAGVIAIYVPASAVDTYKTAWPEVANIISAIPE